eukprot:scaffold10769_cov129-Isochrysis_galbana.AAC.2
MHSCLILFCSIVTWSSAAKSRSLSSSSPGTCTGEGGRRSRGGLRWVGLQVHAGIPEKARCARGDGSTTPRRRDCPAATNPAPLSDYPLEPRVRESSRPQANWNRCAVLLAGLMRRPAPCKCTRRPASTHFKDILDDHLHRLLDLWRHVARQQL